MNKYIIFSGFVGFVLGAIGGGGFMYVRQKKKYEKILEEAGLEDETDLDAEIAEARKKFFENQKEEHEEADVETVPYDLDDIKEKLKSNRDKIAKITDYNKIFSAGELVDSQAEEDDSDGLPAPGEDDILEDEEEIEERTASNIFKEIQKNSGRAPRIVKEEDVSDKDGWDIDSLFLYSNGIITDEDDNVIDGEALNKMIGDCLTKYDFIHSNEKMIYVQCFQLNTFYEINKFDKPFED